MMAYNALQCTGLALRVWPFLATLSATEHGRWSLTESIHHKEISYNGHPTDIQYH